MAKAIANSCYGFLSTSGLNYNAPEQASFITAKGRELLVMTIKWATGQELQYWLDIFNEKTKKKVTPRKKKEIV
jgi:DNA polymerase elongation subunit (family B)